MMRRGTALDGYVDREDRLDEDITPTEKLQREWHDFVEQEGTKRYVRLRFCLL